MSVFIVGYERDADHWCCETCGVEGFGGFLEACDHAGTHSAARIMFKPAAPVGQAGLPMRRVPWTCPGCGRDNHDTGLMWQECRSCTQRVSVALVEHGHKPVKGDHAGGSMMLPIAVKRVSHA